MYVDMFPKENRGEDNFKGRSFNKRLKLKVLLKMEHELKSGE